MHAGSEPSGKTCGQGPADEPLCMLHLQAVIADCVMQCSCRLAVSHRSAGTCPLRCLQKCCLQKQQLTVMGQLRPKPYKHAFVHSHALNMPEPVKAPPRVAGKQPWTCTTQATLQLAATAVWHAAALQHVGYEGCKNERVQSPQLEACQAAPWMQISALCIPPSTLPSQVCTKL